MCTQAALARGIGVLDDLRERGLIRRQPDPADRRARLLSLTRAGRQLRDAVQAAIQQREERLLDRLPEEDRRGFLNALQALAALSPSEIGRE
ncbi:MarR family winged helix-turn-helix transcriptional regulator [Streptomyces herbicida]|uniref:MarR family winged helix-turn-helix transcriptional regulator n=1 Tax=Streptomyces herbicida TaxID=3065675 RepID=UPI002931E9EE|nr:hypothetical protein [Streptomyces sp. NEAU-HV9]